MQLPMASFPDAVVLPEPGGHATQTAAPAVAL
jgi:hypothetical protein